MYGESLWECVCRGIHTLGVCERYSLARVCLRIVSMNKWLFQKLSLPQGWAPRLWWFAD